jgi:hypothetical protein
VAISRPAVAFIVLGVLAAAGITFSAIVTHRHVSRETADAVTARRAFEGIRATWPDRQPLVVLSPDGRPMRQADVPDSPGIRPTIVHILAYEAAPRRLTRAEMPFWFLKMKAGGLRLVTRGTALDLDRLDLTPADLERYGPALILDEQRAGGSRLLVWTE